MAGDFFCLEMGDYYLRIADGEVNSDKIDLRALGLDNNLLTFFTNQNEKSIDEAATRIEKIVNALKISKKNTNIIIPDTYTYSQILSMPYLKEKELLSAIKYQADQFIPLPLEEATIDIDIIHEDKPNNSLLILIVAASQNLIDIVSRIVEKVGLIPERIENEASATCKLINTVYLNRKLKPSQIFINFGYYSSSLYFLNPQLNVLSNLHNFKLGFDLFSREVQVNYNLDKQKADEALRSIGLSKGGSLDLASTLQPVLNEFVTEIEKFVVSVKEKTKIPVIDQLLTFNLAGQINSFNQGLQNRLGIPTATFDLSPLVKKNANFEVYKQYPSSFISVIGGNIR